ncbi:MAG: hypothetical protein QNJ42_22520 [Crocosphaera sp.]|nr:hypothetical protein [Crocosphaera sp.]
MNNKLLLDSLEQVSLVAANYGDSIILADILQDWFNFLGGKPGEVVIVDGGSNLETQKVYWSLFQEGLIDKLQIIQGYHEDNDKKRCYIQEYTAGAIASKPYLLFFKFDTLPYRIGHENWLGEALQYLEREEVFSVGGSFNRRAVSHDAWPGWYFSDKCSLNFSLMKRSKFIQSLHEFAGSYILSGFQEENPLNSQGAGRFLIESALEHYIQKYNQYTLCRVEDENWTVFHTNVHGEQLKKTREEYLKRIDIQRFMNAGLDKEEPIYGQGKYYGNFYGKPNYGLIKTIKIAFGNSLLGPWWRKLKQKWSIDQIRD